MKVTTANYEQVQNDYQNQIQENREDPGKVTELQKKQLDAMKELQDSTNAGAPGAAESAAEPAAPAGPETTAGSDMRARMEFESRAAVPKLATANASTQQAPTGNAAKPERNAAKLEGNAAKLEGNAAKLDGSAQTEKLNPQQSRLIAEAYIGNLQKDFGLSREQAAGIVGNLWHESAGMNSGITQGGGIGQPNSNMADDNQNGYGMCQWGGVRKEALISNAQKNGVDPSSQAAAYGHLSNELRTLHPEVMDAVKKSSSVGEATQIFSSQFLRPSEPHMDQRLARAQDLV